MADVQLDRLFRIQAFVSELLAVAALPSEVWEQVRTRISRPLETGTSDAFSQSDIQEVARETKIAPDLAAAAFRVLSSLANHIASTGADPEELAARVKLELGERGIAVQTISAEVAQLGAAAQQMESLQARAELITRGGRSVSEISVVCDLRLRLSEASLPPPKDMTKYQPEIAELVPLAIVRISFLDIGDGEDCIFQLSLQDIKRLVADLQAASKELETSLGSVTLRIEKTTR